MRKASLLGCAAALLISVVAAPALAGEDEITYRKSVMKSVGGHMKAIATILKTDAGKESHIVHHANAMAALARMAKDAFPKSSSPMDGETEVTMDVWDKPDEFAKVTDAFIAEAEKLAEVAGGGDKGAIGAQLGNLGKNGCKACHDNFRKKS